MGSSIAWFSCLERPVRPVFPDYPFFVTMIKTSSQTLSKVFDKSRKIPLTSNDGFESTFVDLIRY